MQFQRLVAFAVAALTSLACHAQEVRYSFSGVVYQSGSFTNPSFDLHVAVGEAFTGAFWYDASVASYGGGVTQDGGTSYGYRTGGLTIAVGGLTAASTTPAQIFVNDNGYAGYDSFSTSALNPIAITGTSYSADAFFLGLNDVTGKAFSSSALPTTLDSLFNDNSIGLDFVNGLGDQYSIYGNITEFHNVAAVPEPATYALMLAGLGALGFVARRRIS